MVGPCSIHDPEAALEFAERLAGVARQTAGELVVVMRTYFEKPRTSLGWKGLVNDPHLDGSFDLVRGIERAREVLSGVGELGLACASELLDPLAAPYLRDGLAWASIGARTAQSQPHRELASGLPMPVGLKNGTDGRIDGALGALAAARCPQTCLGVDTDGAVAVLRTPGNPDAHLVLRGGDPGPNYDAPSVARAARAAQRYGLARPVFVDCSHGNSSRDPRLESVAWRAVLDQVRDGQGAIGGLLLESQLQAGRQSLRPGKPLRHGISITDACIGWSETQELLLEAAESVAQVHGARARAGLGPPVLREDPGRSGARCGIELRPSTLSAPRRSRADGG